jgi:PAS domain S-box-containing protein
MSVQHAEPENFRTSDSDQSACPANDEPTGAAALSPAETIEQLTQALHRQQAELETQRALLQRTQAALAASEERLNLAQEGAEVGIWDWDVLTGALYWAPQMERLYGQPIGTIRVYEDWSRCVEPEDLARIEAERAVALAQRIPFDQEFRITRGDGSLRWISGRGRGVYDETGALVRVIGINLDITQRKQTEAALLASEARFRSQFEAAPTPTFVWRAVGNQFILIDVNAAAEQLALGKASQFLGMTAEQLYPDRPDLIERFRACMAQQSVITYETDYHSRGAGQDGVIVFTFAFVSPELILLHAENVTERRRAEAALLDQQANMRALLENTDGSIWSVDANYCLTAANSVFLRDTSQAFGREFAVGDCVLARNGPPDAFDSWQAHYDRALHGERFSVETQRRFVDANWVEYRFNPIRNGAGEIMGVTIFGRDITARKQAESLIKDQLSEITFYYDNAPIGLAVLDADLRFVRVNKLLAEINGVPVADHIGRTVEEVVPDLAAQGRNLAASILATGAPVTEVELSGETAAAPGVTRYWREAWHPVQRDDQTIIGFSVISEEITERRQAEAALQRSQQNLARAQQIGRLGSWEWDLSNETLFWSDELYRIFGIERDFLLTYAAIEAAIHPDDRAFNAAKVQEALTAAATVDFEFRIVRPDGAVRHLHQSIEVARNEAGAANKLFGVMQDITERKAADEALLRSEANLRAMIENTDAFIALRDRAGRLVAFNSRFAGLIKLLFDVEARPGLRTTDLQSAGAREHWEAALATVDAGANYHEDFTWELPDATRHFELSLHPIWHDGAVIGSTEFTRDITARKQAEQERAHLQAQLAQAQKMEEIGRLASGIAHDFNNMLAVILMRTELALQGAPPASPLHRNLTAIYTTSQRAAEQVRNLLGFARRQVIAPKVIDLNDAVASALPILHQITGEEIDLVWRPGAPLWPVKLDPAQIDQMLANLCINARDAIGGAGVITLETANVTLADAVATDGQAIAPGDYVLLAVSDTGSGLDAEASTHLFDPYFRVTTVGTGLGLATVDGIMQQNGGQIQVVNEPGVGKTIKLLFLPHIFVNG